MIKNLFKKNIFRHALLVLFIPLSVFFSCEKDLNQYPEGTFRGTWNVEENGTLTGIRRYQVTINKSGINDRVYIANNFYRLGMDSELTIYYNESDSTFRIDGQVINSIFISGSGKFYSDKLLEFHIFANQSGSQINEVNAVFRR